MKFTGFSTLDGTLELNQKIFLKYWLRKKLMVSKTTMLQWDLTSTPKMRSEGHKVAVVGWNIPSSPPVILFDLRSHEEADRIGFFKRLVCRFFYHFNGEIKKKTIDTGIEHSAYILRALEDIRLAVIYREELQDPSFTKVLIAKMAKVHVQNVVVLDNPSNFSNPFQFEITFECVEDLQEDLEWKIIYVGSAESEAYDQVLDTVYVGPVPEGRHMFVFQAEPPQPSKIPVADAVGVTVVLLTCSYRGQEFIRVGYYVNNEYGDAELKENPPTVPQFDKLLRNILATNPRVTRFKVDWDDTNKSGTTKGEQIVESDGHQKMDASIMESMDVM
nr:EOG090X0CKF [Simocephalus serrulatus]